MSDKRLASRVRRGDLLLADCPSRGVLQHVTSRWGVLLFVVLLEGTHRFSELRRKVSGVSEKMLAQTLRWLEDDGFVGRRSFNTVPPHVEYCLTPLGLEVGQRVEGLADWIEENMAVIAAERRAVVAAKAQVPGRVVVKAGRAVANRGAPLRRQPGDRG
jgi:DNA-binding HxlR family transcriptional regulator